MKAAVSDRKRCWLKGTDPFAVFTLLCGCLFLMPGTTAFAAKQSVIESDRRTVTVGVPAHLPPHFQLDEAGQPQGFAIDVFREIAKDVGITPGYRIFADMAELDRAWRRGDIDIVPGAAITRGGRLDARYTDAIETFAVSIFVRQANTSPRDGMP